MPEGLTTPWAGSLSAPLRFLVAGGVNTAATWGLYLLLLGPLGYAVSYTVAFLTGIAFSYMLNRRFVFGSRETTPRHALFPLVYVAQYGAGLGIVWLCVEIAGLPAAPAPLLALIVTIPLTYLLSRWVFSQDTRDI